MDMQTDQAFDEPQCEEAFEERVSVEAFENYSVVVQGSTKFDTDRFRLALNQAVVRLHLGDSDDLKF